MQQHRPPVRTRGTKRSSSVNTSELTALQERTIELFAAAATAFRMPKSAGEIYGLLFVSLRPVPLECILTSLDMSRGTAGQALKLLRSMGAVKRVYAEGNRSNCYLAEMELWSLATGILRDRIGPQVAQGSETLNDLERLLAFEPEGDHEAIQERLRILRYWNHQVSEFIPLLIDHLASPPASTDPQFLL